MSGLVLLIARQIADPAMAFERARFDTLGEAQEAYDREKEAVPIWRDHKAEIVCIGAGEWYCYVAAAKGYPEMWVFKSLLDDDDGQ